MSQRKRLAGKKVLVTGAGGGIGRATCLTLLQQGAEVVASDNDPVALQETVVKASQIGTALPARVCDVSSAQSCQATVEFAAAEMGGLNVLFNNAGIIKRTDVLSTTEADWDRVMDVNLKSVFLMSKYAVPEMLRAGGGNIINTASGWGINGGAKAITYCASKGGVVLLTKALAVDLGKDNIRVNSICPGDTHTQMLIGEARQLGLPDDHLVNEGDQRPLGRIGMPEEIADGVAFLASDESKFMTGSNLVVDGGGLAGSP